jgi:hypothetical protein
MSGKAKNECSSAQNTDITIHITKTAMSILMRHPQKPQKPESKISKMNSNSCAPPSQYGEAKENANDKKDY